MFILRYALALLSCWTIFLTPVLATAAQKAITITLPDTVIEEMIQKTLPVNIPLKSQAILGSVSVDAIKNVQLGQDKITGKVTLTGHDIHLITNLLGHNLRMKIGSLTMSFLCDAVIRFDPKKQILFIKPTIKELHSSDQAKTEAASLIAQLFNNQEFPLELNKLQPISADLGEKTLHITIHPHTILVKPGKIELATIPKIKTSPKK